MATHLQDCWERKQCALVCPQMWIAWRSATHAEAEAGEAEAAVAPGSLMVESGPGLGLMAFDCPIVPSRRLRAATPQQTRAHLDAGGRPPRTGQPRASHNGQQRESTGTRDSA